LVLNGKKAKTTEEKCVRSVSYQPTEEELKNLTLSHLSVYYFNGVEVFSPVVESHLKIKNHVGPTVKELSTIQKFRSSFSILHNDVSTLSKKLTSLQEINKAAIGTIAIWKGSQNTIPSGWVFCDGNNGTPDLTDKFVLGAGSRQVFSSGGSEEVKLSILEMPSHAHEFLDHATKHYTVRHAYAYNYKTGSWEESSLLEEIGHQNDDNRRITEYVGNGRAHENMPPFFTLCYIMKIR